MLQWIKKALIFQSIKTCLFLKLVSKSDADGVRKIDILCGKYAKPFQKVLSQGVQARLNPFLNPDPLSAVWKR